MNHAKPQGWSYSAGERGRNRVRTYQHPETGRLFLELYEQGKRKRLALRHSDHEEAKRQADEVAARIALNARATPHAPTLNTLFDIYLAEVTPSKGKSKQSHDHRAAKLFLTCFGADRPASTLNRRDWDHYIQWRREHGDRRTGSSHGNPVGSRIIEYDLRFLQAVLNWAAKSRADGTPMLERNPIKGAPWPKQATPNRPALSDEEYQALFQAASTISPQFRLALILAHETGHRANSIRLLRWSDIDWTGQSVRWRGENDKIGFDHATPLTEPALQALEVQRDAQQAIGEAWVFPAPKDPGQPCSRHLFRNWWLQAEDGAGLKRVRGRGWHSLRRKFATEMKHTPLRDLSHLGGWKEPATILKCYQRADEATMRAALEGRAQLQTDGTVSVNRHREPTPSTKSHHKTNPA